MMKKKIIRFCKGNLQKLIFSRPATEEKAEFTDVNEHFDEGAKRRKNNFSRSPIIFGTVFVILSVTYLLITSDF
jgi:hypothetical protein